jgi:hypothetical protein
MKGGDWVVEVKIDKEAPQVTFRVNARQCSAGRGM